MCALVPRSWYFIEYFGLEISVFFNNPFSSHHVQIILNQHPLLVMLKGNDASSGVFGSNEKFISSFNLSIL